MQQTLGEQLDGAGEEPAETVRCRRCCEWGVDLTEADEASTHTPDGLCCPPLMTTPDGPSPTGFRLETADSAGERPRMELRSGRDTDVHRRQVPQDRHHPWGPLPKLRRAEKRQCSLDIPRQNSWGAAPPHSGTAPAGRERAARQVPAGRRGAARAPVLTSPTGGEGRALRQAGNGGQEIHCERGWGVNPGSMAPYPAKASYWKARPLGGDEVNKQVGWDSRPISPTTGTAVAITSQVFHILAPPLPSPILILLPSKTGAVAGGQATES